MADKNDIVVDFQTGDPRNILTALDKIIDSLGQLNSTVQDLAKTGGVGKVLRKDAAEAQRASKGLKQAVDTVGDATDNAVKQIDRLNDSAGKKSPFNDMKGGFGDMAGALDNSSNSMDRFNSSGINAGDTINDVVENVRKLREEQERLKGILNDSATQPGDIATTEKQLSNVERRLKSISENLPSDQFVKLAQEATSSFKTIDLSIADVDDEINKLYKDRKALELVFNNSNDPYIKGEAQKRYAEITDELEKQTKLRQQQSDLGRQDVRGKGGDEKIAAALDKISTVANSFESMTAHLGDAETGLKLWTNSIIDNGMVTQEYAVTIQDVASGISDAVDNQVSGFQKIKDIQGNVGNIGNSLSSWSSKILANNQAITDAGGTVGKLDGFLGGLAKGAGGLSKILGGLSKVIGIFGVAIQGAQLGFDLYDAATGKSADAIAKRVAALAKEADQLKENNSLIREGSVDALERQRRAILDNINDLDAQRDAAVESVAANTSAFDMLRTALDVRIHEAFGGVATVYGAQADAIRESNKQLGEMNDNLNELSDDGLRSAIDRVSKLNDVARKANDILGDLGGQEEELYGARADMYQKQDQLSKDLNKLDKDFDEETSDIKGKRLDDEKNELKDHLDNLSTMETDYNESVEQGRQDHLNELQQLENGYIEESANALKDYQKSLSDLSDEYHQSELEEEETWREDQAKDKKSYEKRLAKMEEDFNKAKIKRQKDLQEQLFEAELDNDALQYFKLQRQGEKDEKDAQDDYNDQRQEEIKSFNEEQADKAEERAKDKAQRQKDYEEKRAEMAQQFAESTAERKNQHEKELQQQKDAYAKKLVDDQYQYDKERAKAVEEFNKKQADQQAEYAAEDSARQDQKEKRRKDLVDNFNLELEYFAQREKVLMDYINQIKDVQKTFATAGTIGSSVDNKNEQSFVLSQIVPAIDRLMAINERSTDENQQLKALQDIQTALENTDVTQKSVELSPESQILLNDAITANKNAALVKVQQDNSLKLKFPDEDARKRYEEAQKDIGGSYQNIASASQDLYKDLDLQQTKYGYSTTQETADQAKRRQAILENEGNDSVQTLRERARDQGTAIQAGFSDEDRRRRAFQQGTADEQEDHFYNLEDGQRTAYENQEIGTKAAYDAQQDIQGEGQSLMNDQTAAFYGASGEQQVSANQSELDTDAAHNLALGDQSAAAGQAELDQNASQNQDQLNQADEFGGELENTIGGGYADTMDAIERESQRGTTAAAAAYQRLANEIVASANRALAQVRSMAMSSGSGNSMASVTASINRGGGASFGSGRSATGGVLHSRGGRGLLAASGAFIDRPTSVVAGEGKRPEVIFPFDKSKGIPPDILIKMGRGFADGLRNGNTGINGGRMNYPMPTTTGSINSKAVIEALGKLQKGMALSIGTIMVGSDMSREEVRQQFVSLEEVIVKTVRQAVAGGG